MVNKRSMGGMVAAFAMFLAFPALASAHLLAVSASPAQCVTPLNGSYTSTVTVTETYFSGTTENIPVGKNVYELSTSTDKGNTGLNQNYFTTSSVGTQSGSANLGQPVSFTSPRSGGAATQQFTVTTSVPETYVLGNSYMGTPSSATITAPHGGCAPVAPTVSVTATTQCTAALNGTFTATIDVRSSGAFAVPAGSGGGAAGTNEFTPAASGQPSSFGNGDTTFTVGGLTRSTVYAVGAPGGNVATVTLAVPSSGCMPPSCPSGQTLVNGTCTPPTSCPNGETLMNGTCTPPTSCPNGETLMNGTCTPPTSCPNGETLMNGTCTPPTSCPTGETLAGSQCVPPTDCPTGDSMTAGGCTPPTPAVVVPPAPTFPAVCRASTKDYKVRAGQQDTVIVSVNRQGAPVTGTQVRVTLPGGKVLTRATGKNGTATFRVKPTHSGTILVHSPSCTETIKVKVYAAKAATAVRAPSFTG
jgi:hypothetical protein